MLIEEVVLAFIEEKSIGIINPILFRGEVKSWTEFLGKYTERRTLLHGAYLILIT